MPSKAEHVQWVPAWLARDGHRNMLGGYVLFFTEAQPVIDADGLWRGNHGHSIRSELFPCRLEPGGGPIAVEVAIRKKVE